MSLISAGPSPSALATNLYRAGGRLTMKKSPCSLAFTERSAPVFWLVMVMLAPGITAPLESATDPTTREDSVCPHAMHMDSTKLQESSLVRITLDCNGGGLQPDYRRMNLPIRPEMFAI